MNKALLFLSLVLGSFQSLFAGNPDLFYYVSDGTDELYSIDRTTGTTTLIGSTGVTNIEAIAYYPIPGANQLFAANAGDFGSLSLTTGAFTLIGEIDGGGTANGASGAQSLDDVDGLMFDGRTFKLWAIERKAGATPDLLFQIDPSTGLFVPNAFGPGIDYIVISGNGADVDVDDLAVSPVTGKIYATTNNGGTGDQLLYINKYTGVFSTVVTLAQDDVEGLAFSNDGTLYGSEGDAENQLSEINISTGAMTNSFTFTGSDVEALASLVADANQMTGTVFDDSDYDGVQDGGEAGLAGITLYVYLDNNGDGLIDPEDTRIQTIETDGSGNFEVNYASTGTLLVSTAYASYPSGYALTTDNVETATFTDNVNFGESDASNLFGLASGPDCDNDGLPNFYEGNLDSDGDAIPDSCDLDSDNDGILDQIEGVEDFDDDGIPNYRDRDSDDDGIPDAIEANAGITPTGYVASTGIVSGTDSDGNGIVDSRETSAGSGVMVASNPDSDNDGKNDYLDLDSDNDGILDIIEGGGTDTDLDGQVDGLLDANSNGLDDRIESNPLTYPNSDENYENINGLTNLPNYIDKDSDGDGIDDTREGYSTNGYEFPSLTLDSDDDGIIDFWDVSADEEPITPYDRDSDDVPDYMDGDSDNDGISDFIEGNDADNDGVEDQALSGLDADNNGIDDAFDASCSEQISIGAADYAEENNGTTTVNLASTDLEFVNDGGTLQTVGIYFSGIPLSQGTSVNSAYLQFETDEVSTGSVTVTIEGELTTNASSFSGTNGEVSGLSPTTNTVSWTPADWNTIGEASTAQLTPDLRTIINEIVGQGGWAENNGLNLIFSGSNTVQRRTAEVNPTLILNLDAKVCSSVVALPDFDGDGEYDFRDMDDDDDGIPSLSETTDADGSGQVDYLETTISSCGVGFVDDSVFTNTPVTTGAVAQTNVGVADAASCLGSADGVDANIQPGDTVILDFGDTITGGTNYDVVYSRQTAGGSNAIIMTIEESMDGISFTTSTTAPTTSSKTLITESVAADNDFRYLRITASSPGLDLDAMSVTVNQLDTTINCETDSDYDGVADINDVDDDNDGILDVNEGEGANNPVGDEDNDGILNYLDNTDNGNGGDGSTTDYTDTNGDGIPDVFDSDGDGIPNHLDLDSDNDGVPDIIEAGGTDSDANGRADVITDTDGDGWSNTFDSDNGGTALADNDTDGDGIENRLDLDSDDDGVADIVEAGGEDTDGDGRADDNTDTDGDGFADTFDSDDGGTPLANQDSDGDGILNYLDLDSDNDGITDNVEAQTTASFLAPLGTDTDGDGWDDRYDSDNGGTAITLSNNEGFGNPDYTDTDSDGDGYYDWAEGFDDNQSGDALDDLIGRATTYEAAASNPLNYVNTDDADFDGMPDWLEDDDGDEVPNFLDPDSGFYLDTDGDGLVDLFDTDNFGQTANLPDADGDGAYDFRDIDNTISLPIDLLYFEAKPLFDVVQLDWETLTELNNDYFVVERLNAEGEFVEIARVKGAGNSNEPRLYRLLDQEPIIGMNYYQLRQVDFDGQFSLSEIRAVKFSLIRSNEIGASIYPNPGNGEQLFVKFDENSTAEVRIELYSGIGRLMLTRIINNATELSEIEILNGLRLEAGVYFINIRRGENLDSFKYIIH